MNDGDTLQILQYLKRRVRTWRKPPPPKGDFKQLLLAEIEQKFPGDNAYEAADLALTLWMEGGDFVASRNSRMTTFWVIVFIAFFAFFGIVLSNLPALTQNATGIGSFAVIALISLVCAVGLFGVLRSTGTFSGSGWGMTFQLGGAAALFALMMCAGIWYELKLRKVEFAFAVYLCLDGSQKTSIPVDGTLSLFMEEKKDIPIIKGAAYPQRIPSHWAGQSVRYSISASGYSEVGDSTLKLDPNAQLFVPVHREANNSVPATSH